MNNCCICWFSRIHVFLLGILIFEGLTARRLYKSFGVKGLISKHIKRKCDVIGVYSLTNSLRAYMSQVLFLLYMIQIFCYSVL
jgi:hypothetical protein